MTWLDIVDVVAIEKDLFLDDPWTPELFWSELAQVPESREVMVAVINNAIVGYVSLRFVGSDGDVNTIAVHSDYQGQGVGKHMIAWLEATAITHGVTQLFLDVRSDNAPAMSMYVSRGYEQIDQRRNYYGTDVHAIVMRKRIAS